MIADSGASSDIIRSGAGLSAGITSILAGGNGAVASRTQGVAESANENNYAMHLAIPAAIAIDEVLLGSASSSMFKGVGNRITDSRLQPWTIRSGQGWKTKIYGRGQKSTPGHEVKSYRIAINEAKGARSDKVYLNQGMNRITGRRTHKPNYRHDVTVKRKDGKMDMYEVRSKTDKPGILRERMQDSRRQLPKEQRSDVADIVDITKTGDK